MEFIRLHSTELWIGGIGSFAASLLFWLFKKIKNIKIPIWTVPIIIFLTYIIILASSSNFKSDELEVIAKKKFGTERVILDGKSFINCTFDRTDLIFNGEQLFSIEGCQLRNTRLVFDKYSNLTIQQLHILYKDKDGFSKHAKDVIQHIINPNNPDSKYFNLPNK